MLAGALHLMCHTSKTSLVLTWLSCAHFCSSSGGSCWSSSGKYDLKWGSRSSDSSSEDAGSAAKICATGRRRSEVWSRSPDMLGAVGALAAALHD